MADDTTVNFNFTLPDVGGSDGSWGGKLNANFSAIDSVLANAIRGATPISGTLPSSASRAGKVLGFDGGGSPIAIAIGSSIDPSLRSDIAATTGAELVGYGDSTLGEALDSNPRVSVLQYISKSLWPAIMAGTSNYDASTAVQTWVDNNKGGHLVIPHAVKKLIFAGLLLDGASYDGTRVDIEGVVYLKTCPSVSTTNYQSALWGGIILRKVTGASVNMLGGGVFDGAMLTQPAYEQIHCLVLSGVTRFNSQRLAFRDVAGDGVFLGMSTLSSNPAGNTNNDGFSVGELVGWNTSKGRGRNLISITSGINGRVGSVESYDIGGTVGGTFRMPGGWDFETDFDWQQVDRWVIGSAKITSQGLSGFGINGRNGFPVTNIEVGSLQVINDLTPDGTLDGTGAATLANVSLLTINYGSNIRISNYEGVAASAYAALGVVVNGSDRVFLRGCVSHVVYGLRGGQDLTDSLYGAGVTRADIDLSVSDVCREGFFLGEITGGRIRGEVTDPKTGHYPSGLFGVNVSGGSVVNCELSVDVPYNANWNRTYRNSGGATLTGTVIADCAMLGAWPYDDKLIGDVVVPKINVLGVTDTNLDAGAPFGTASYWKAGQVVRNTTGTVGKPQYYVYNAGGSWTAGPNF